MQKLQVAFGILDTKCKPPPGWLKASGNIIFDVRMKLERKDRWAKYGHRTPKPENLTYDGLVSQERVLGFP